MTLLISEFEASVVEVFSLPCLKLLHLLLVQMGFPVTHFTCEEREKKCTLNEQERNVCILFLYFKVDVYLLSHLASWDFRYVY